MFDSLPFHIFGDAERVRDAVLSYSGKLLEYICSEGAALIGSTAKALPSFMLSAVVSAVSFFYLMADIDGVGAAVSSLIPEEKRERVVSAFRNVSDAVFGYIRGTSFSRLSRSQLFLSVFSSSAFPLRLKQRF